MRDLRRAPFCWQGVDAMALIRERWRGRKRTVAVALYQAMTEISNEERSDRFVRSARQVGERAGTSPRTATEYAPDFEELGLLKRHERTGEGGAVLSPEWELTSPDPPAAAAAPPAAADAQTPDPPAAVAGLTQETSRETKTLGTTSRRPTPSAPDVERLCSLLEEHANAQAETPGRARVKEGWRTAIDRLLRIDGRTPEQVEYVINWLAAGKSEGAQFWAGNVLSGPKLREKFDRMVALIKREQQNGAGRRATGVTGAELRAAAAELRKQGR